MVLADRYSTGPQDCPRVESPLKVERAFVWSPWRRSEHQSPTKAKNCTTRVDLSDLSHLMTISSQKCNVSISAFCMLQSPVSHGPSVNYFVNIPALTTHRLNQHSLEQTAPLTPVNSSTQVRSTCTRSRGLHRGLYSIAVHRRLFHTHTGREGSNDARIYTFTSLFRWRRTFDPKG